MRLKTKNYILAGLDFIFDENDNPWFLEANGLPRSYETIMKELYGKSEPVKKLSQIIDYYGKNFCILPPRKRILFKKDIPTLLSEFRRYLKADIHLCFLKDNKNKRKKLLDENGVNIYPDSILKCLTSFMPKSLEKSPALLINPLSVLKITRNKLYTIDIVRKNTKARVPKTFLIKNASEVEKIVEKENFESFVIKPIRGTGGHNVFVLSRNEQIPKIKTPFLLGQCINPKLRDKRHWDVRVYLVNGEMAGGFIRETMSKVTNIARGANASKITKKLLNKLIRPSMEIVRAIDKEAEKIKFKR